MACDDPPPLDDTDPPDEEDDEDEEDEEDDVPVDDEVVEDASAATAATTSEPATLAAISPVVTASTRRCPTARTERLAMPTRLVGLPRPVLCRDYEFPVRRSRTTTLPVALRGR